MLSPSTWTTRPSTGGNAETTSWSMRLNVAPTWSATPAWTGSASRSAAGPEESAAARLEDNRGLVNTEDAPKRVADLAERHLRSHGVEDDRDEVVAAARGPVHGLERARRVSGIARAPETLQALGHRPTDGGIDLEEAGGRRLVH